MLTSLQQEILEESISTKVEYECSLKAYTTFKIGGPASALVVVESVDELSFLLDFCSKEELPLLCIGKGSNLLIADEGFRGIAFRLGKAFETVDILTESSSSCSEKKVAVRVGAASRLAKLSGFCCKKGLSGMEFSGGIPGSIGGAVVMNAGAWGREMAEVVCGVELVDRERAFFIEKEQLDFSYRSWPWFAKRYQQSPVVVTAVELVLSESSSVEVASRCRELAQRRKSAQRTKKPSAGSFFKNPPGKSAGRLIESCGLKGLRVGDAMVADEHANFFVNMGAAKASEMRELMETVQKNVKMRCGVELEPEVKIIS